MPRDSQRPPADAASEAFEELRRRREAADERYRALCEFLPVPLLLLNRHGVMREVNPAFCRLLGGTRESHVGLALQGRMGAVDRRILRQHLARCRANEEVTSDLVVLGPTGEPIAVRLVSSPAPHDDESYWTAMLDVRDTRQLQAERDALASFQSEARRAAEARDVFVAVLGHELRSPLAAISAAASTLLGPAEELDVPRLAALLSRSARAMVRIVDDLHDLTRLTRGNLQLELQPVDLHAVLEDVVETFAAEIDRSSLTLDRDLRAGQHVVVGDPDRLRQVFWNLVKNALKFTPAGGRIGLRSWNRDDDTLVLEVSDTGEGIAPALLPVVFNRYEQAAPLKGSGLGLGLAIAKGIVEQHAGRITAASPGPGRGARFLVELPVAAGAVDAPAAAARTSTPVAAPPATRVPGLLLVEDNAELAEALMLGLEGQGCRVHVAASVEEALAAPLDEVDLLLTDIDLPDGNGRDLLRKIKERRPVAAIALSGFIGDREVKESEAAGFLAHLKKPVDLGVLQRAIARALGRDRPPSGRASGR